MQISFSELYSDNDVKDWIDSLNVRARSSKTKMQLDCIAERYFKVVA